MAARAGADQVFSCEVNPAIADAAKEIVAINGFAKIIHVLDKHSTKLEADTDLDGRVDLIVSEVVSNNMLSEGVLTTMEHAVKNLLKPDGQVIPAKGGVRVALAFEPGFSERRMEITDGFDLTPFNRLAKPRYGIPTEDPHLRVMSEAVDLFEFDFRAATHEPEAHAQRTLTARGGSVNCIAQWIYLEMDEAAGYENRPGQATYSNWATMIHPLPRQGSLRAMDTITVNGSHDLCGLRIWV